MSDTPGGNVDPALLAQIKAKMESDPNYRILADPQAQAIVQQMLPQSLKDITFALQRAKNAFDEAQAAPNAITNFDDAFKVADPSFKNIAAPKSKFFKGLSTVPPGEVGEKVKSAAENYDILSYIKNNKELLDSLSPEAKKILEDPQFKMLSKVKFDMLREKREAWAKQVLKGKKLKKYEVKIPQEYRDKVANSEFKLFAGGITDENLEEARKNYIQKFPQASASDVKKFIAILRAYSQMPTEIGFFLYKRMEANPTGWKEELRKEIKNM
jgi:hypothetical protein